MGLLAGIIAIIAMCQGNTLLAVLFFVLALVFIDE